MVLSNAGPREWTLDERSMFFNPLEALLYYRILTNRALPRGAAGGRVVLDERGPVVDGRRTSVVTRWVRS